MVTRSLTSMINLYDGLKRTQVGGQTMPPPEAVWRKLDIGLAPFQIILDKQVMINYL